MGDAALTEGVRDAPCARTLTGTRPEARCSSLPWRSGPVSSYCPRSSLPAKVLGWLAARLAHLNPPRRSGQGGIRPLALEVRLDAVAAVVLDGLSYRRAGRMVGISKTEVGDSLDLLLGPLGALGFCQPDGTFITSLDDLCRWLAEMARSGEAVCLDGLAIRVQRPREWANQKVLYDAKRHTHTAQGLAVSSVHGDLLGVDGGWPGSCHEHELVALSGLDGALDGVAVVSLLDRGSRGPGQVTRALACAGRGPPHHRPPHRRPVGLQPSAGRAARAGGAGDRRPCRRLGAASLAGAAVSGAGCLPGRWCAHLPGPMAAPGTRMTKHRGHLNHTLRTTGTTRRRSSAPRSAARPSTA
jgi:DDE superfamily endonuclease